MSVNAVYTWMYDLQLAQEMQRKPRWKYRRSEEKGREVWEGIDNTKLINVGEQDLMKGPRM